MYLHSLSDDFILRRDGLQQADEKSTPFFLDKKTIKDCVDQTAYKTGDQIQHSVENARGKMVLGIMADQHKAHELIDFPNHRDGHGEEKSVSHLQNPIFSEAVGFLVTEPGVNVEAYAEKEHARDQMHYFVVYVGAII